MSMDAHPAYFLGSACADVRQAARLLRRRFISDAESAAWFVLGFWRLRQADIFRDVVKAIAEQRAIMAYDPPAEPADDAWARWLLYASVQEVKRVS
jgi:hypothetical protein